MSGPLCGLPDGTTSSAHVVNTCAPAGHCPNNMPIYITGGKDTRTFIAWLRASYPSDLTVQLKAIFPWSPWGNRSLRPRKPKSLSTVWRLSFSRWPFSRSRQLLRLLTWRWILLHDPCQWTKVKQPDEVQEAIRGLNIRIPNRALKHLPERAVILTQIFNTVLRTHHIPSAWKHARVISILKPWKDPAQPTFYRPINLFDTIGKLFEILLTKILNEVGECGLLRDEQFVFRPCSWLAS
jgi:hypothetical protein